MIRALLFACIVGSAVAFAPRQSARVSSALNAKSKSLPFLDQPKVLDGSLPGDVGFDPAGFTSNEWFNPFATEGEAKDWSKLVVPDMWAETAPRTPISTLQWMREAELKHSRLAMLAVLGWVAVDFGIRFPGDMFASIPNSLVAHNAAVQNGSMVVLLFVVSLLELCTGAAIYDQSKGSGRKSGEFNFDPLGLGRDPKSRERYATNEIKNGRLAMLAISGIVTQAAAFPDKAFPFF